jgi:hypothetical protein
MEVGMSKKSERSPEGQLVSALARLTNKLATSYPIPKPPPPPPPPPFDPPFTAAALRILAASLREVEEFRAEDLKGFAEAMATVYPIPLPHPTPPGPGPYPPPVLAEHLEHWAGLIERLR